jgi:hypothetical protein
MFTVPTDRIGEVMGLLTKSGAWPDELEPENDGQVVYKARVPNSQVRAIRSFIADIPDAKMEPLDA